MNWNPITAGIEAVGGFFKKREDRKINKDSAIAKLQQMKQGDATNITLTDAEGEAVLARGLTESWKDEYVTILITAPYALLILGAVYLVFSGDSRLLDGATQAISGLEAVGVDMGFLMEAVVLGALGLKIWRK